MESNASSHHIHLAAVCGLYCPGCIIYIADRETPEKRADIAAFRQTPVEALRCDGCRSDNRYVYCDSCKLYACAMAKGLDFCGACEAYPCEDFKEFQAARPHRLELFEAQERIREVGAEQWLAEMEERYACPQCGTLNSAYHLACRQCGATPSNAYVAEHKETLLAYIAARRAGAA